LQLGRPAQQCIGRSLVKVGGTYVARAIWQYRTKPQSIGEGVETGWQAPHAGEGTVRLSPKGESDRITQRSAVQIRPPQPRTPLPKCSGVRPFWTLRKSADDVHPRQPYGFGPRSGSGQPSEHSETSVILLPSGFIMKRSPGASDRSWPLKRILAPSGE